MATLLKTTDQIIIYKTFIPSLLSSLRERILSVLLMLSLGMSLMWANGMLADMIQAKALNVLVKLVGSGLHLAILILDGEAQK